MKLASALVFMLVFGAAAAPQGKVSDSEAAVKIAEKALIRVYG
jgi:hypothetical protein